MGKKKKQKELEVKASLKGIKLSSQKLTAKPKAKIRELNAVKTVLKGTPAKVKMVTEGEEGYFNQEYEKERINFLGGYSL